MKLSISQRCPKSSYSPKMEGFKEGYSKPFYVVTMSTSIFRSIVIGVFTNKDDADALIAKIEENEDILQNTIQSHIDDNIIKLEKMADDIESLYDINNEIDNNLNERERLKKKFDDEFKIFIKLINDEKIGEQLKTKIQNVIDAVQQQTATETTPNSSSSNFNLS